MLLRRQVDAGRVAVLNPDAEHLLGSLGLYVVLHGALERPDDEDVEVGPFGVVGDVLWFVLGGWWLSLVTWSRPCACS